SFVFVFQSATEQQLVGNTGCKLRAVIVEQFRLWLADADSCTGWRCMWLLLGWIGYCSAATPAARRLASLHFLKALAGNRRAFPLEFHDNRAPPCRFDDLAYLSSFKTFQASFIFV